MKLATACSTFKYIYLYTNIHFRYRYNELGMRMCHISEWWKMKNCVGCVMIPRNYKRVILLVLSQRRPTKKVYIFKHVHDCLNRTHVGRLVFLFSAVSIHPGFCGLERCSPTHLYRNIGFTFENYCCTGSRTLVENRICPTLLKQRYSLIQPLH